MEKYSQFRDKGSGIAPFLPIPHETSLAYFPLYLFLFIIRLPIILALSLIYFVVFSWLPVPTLLRKGALWTILGTPGIWWIDLQIDGVKRGSLAKHKTRLPQPGTVIASSFTSPLDCLYLAAIFDPIFTASYPGTRLVQRISLLQAIFRALSSPKTMPSPGAKLVTVASIMSRHPKSIVVVLPECTTSNGKGILAFSPSMLSAAPKTRIYPLNLRYSPQDVTTPLPGAYLSFIWNLCSQPTHTIRVRIALPVSLPATTPKVEELDGLLDPISVNGNGRKATTGPDTEEQKLLDHVADNLARLGRVKRVGLGAHEKVEFVRVWTKTRTIW